MVALPFERPSEVDPAGSDIADLSTQRKQALFGLRSDSATIYFFDTAADPSSTRFGMAFGGGVDLRLSPRWALRVQGDYLYSRLGEKTAGGFLVSETQTIDGFRISVGPVYRFGSAAAKRP